MGLRITLSALLCAACTFLFAQNKPHCGTDEWLNSLLQSDSTAAAQLEQNWKAVYDYIENSNSAQRAEGDGIITIPVVFHVIHNGPSSVSNISDTQILSQLEVLNECYRKNSPNTFQIPNEFKNRHADIGIEFCLAKFDEDGKPTTGIERFNRNDFTSGDFDVNVKSVTSWNTAYYLNIWTTTLNGQILGYATPPNMGPANQNGVVLDYRHVGRAPANPFASNNNLGKTCVHEVGHWLGLYHVFQDSCAGSTASTCAWFGDRVCDTPQSAEESYGTPNLLQNTCTDSPTDENDMWMNYMDYVDDINLQMFTTGQRAVMRATLNTSRLTIQSGMGCTDTTTAFNYTGKVVDAQTNQGVPTAKVLFDGARDYEVTTDANGNFTVPNLFEGRYNIYAGKWGYRETFYAKNMDVTYNSPALTIPIPNHHYYDDFLFGFGWTTSQTASSGAWVRTIPIGSYDASDFSPSNPSTDFEYDYGARCYVTGNGKTIATQDNVDNGTVTLISPVFDLTGYTDPYLQYVRWFYNASQNAGAPDDKMSIRLNDGTSQATVEEVTSSENSWTQKSFRIKDIAGINLTNSMRFSVVASDLASGNANIVEAGIDRFEVLEGNTLGIADALPVKNVSVYPNPSPAVIHVTFTTAEPAKVIVQNLVGQNIKTIQTAAGNQQLKFDLEEQPAGLYFISIRTGQFEKNVKFSLAR